LNRVYTLVAISFALGGVLYAYALRDETPDARRKGWVKYLVYFAIVNAILLCRFAGNAALAAVVALIGLAGAAEIARTRHVATRSGRAQAAVWSVYGPLAVLATVGTWVSPPDRVIFVFAVVAAFDGACEVSGRLFGRTKLSPMVSPNKTVEGLAGGLFVAAIVAIYLADLATLTPVTAVVAGSVVSVVALAGDLSASWIKRRAGIKDFGGLIPGHGGALDRFDGFLPNCALLAFVALGDKVGQ
jgi:phosphatidate cytidylyltransferase